MQERRMLMFLEEGDLPSSATTQVIPDKDILCIYVPVGKSTSLYDQYVYLLVWDDSGQYSVGNGNSSTTAGFYIKTSMTQYATQLGVNMSPNMITIESNSSNIFNNTYVAKFYCGSTIVNWPYLYSFLDYYLNCIKGELVVYVPIYLKYMAFYDSRVWLNHWKISNLYGSYATTFYFEYAED